MGTTTVTEQQQVSGEVRKEQIDMEPGTDGARNTAGTSAGTTGQQRDQKCLGSGGRST